MEDSTTQGTPTPDSQSQGRSRAWILTALVVVVLCAAGLYLFRCTTGTHTTAGAGGTSSVPLTGASPYTYPGDGHPVTWNPCAPIPYVVNDAHEPAAAQGMVTAAIAKLSAASGLHFQYAGPTTAVPQADWSQSQRLGRPGYAPLIIAFAAPAQSNLLANAADRLGDGGDAWVPGPEGKVAVSGSIVLNDQAALAPGFGPTASWGMLILHELAHAVGMAHSSDPYSYLYPTLGVVAQSITPLDQSNLAVLSAGGCRTAPGPTWG